MIREIILTWLQGYDGPGNLVDYSVFDPFNSSSYFHPYCLITDYNNQTDVQDCWLGDTTVSLPDLNTKEEGVRRFWYDWITDLVSKYSSMSLVICVLLLSSVNAMETNSQNAVDGLRIDTARHVEKTFWDGYNQAAGVYCMGEVLDKDPVYTCKYQSYMDAVLNYPM